MDWWTRDANKRMGNWLKWRNFSCIDRTKAIGMRMMTLENKQSFFFIINLKNIFYNNFYNLFNNTIS